MHRHKQQQYPAGYTKRVDIDTEKIKQVVAAVRADKQNKHYGSHGSFDGAFFLNGCLVCRDCQIDRDYSKRIDDRNKRYENMNKNGVIQSDP